MRFAMDAYGGLTAIAGFFLDRQCEGGPRGGEAEPECGQQQQAGEAPRAQEYSNLDRDIHVSKGQWDQKRNVAPSFW
jgi:hypothetical protein